MNRLSNRVEALEEKTGKGFKPFGLLMLNEGDSEEQARAKYLAENGGTEDDYNWLIVSFIKPKQRIDEE